MVMKNQIQRYVKFMIYMCAVVLINVAGITLFFRIDLTNDKMYSISKASKKVVSTLSEPLTINVFFSKNLPAPYNNTERYLHDLLEEYAIHSNKFFNYRFYDVSLEGTGITAQANENQQLAKNYGIRPVQIQNIEKDEVKFQKAYMGLVIIHGDMIEKIPTITSTDGLEYQLTTSIQKLNNKVSALLNLDEKIEIKLFLSSSLNIIAGFIGLTELDGIPEKLEAVIEKLNATSFGKLSFEHFDPSKDDRIKSLKEKYDIMTLSWPAIPKENIESGSGSAGLIVEYKDKALSIPLVKVMKIPIFGTQYSMTEMDELEETINENIESIIDINDDIGYLADHGTPEEPMPNMMNPLQQTQSEISVFRNLISQNYTFRDIKLKDSDIPDSFNCLIIAGPKEPFSDYELFQIDQFLMRGKSLALFLDAFKEFKPEKTQPFAYNQPPQFIPVNTGLEKLLEHYGVRLKYSYVMDENCYKQITQTRMGEGETAIYFAPMIKKERIDHSLDFMQNINELVVMKVSPLELLKKPIEENRLTGIQLIASSKKSWEMSKGIILNPMYINPPSNDEMQSKPLAYYLEGEFPSYFAGKPIPEKTSVMTEQSDKEKSGTEPAEKKDNIMAKIKDAGTIITKSKPAKIFVLASSEVLKNNMLDAEGRSTNATFIMNVLDGLNGRNEIALMRSKNKRFNPLSETEPAVRTFIKTFNIVVLPIMVAAFGIFVFFRRRSRQKVIQLMFQK